MLNAFHYLRTTQISTVLWECQNESGVCDGKRWIVACRLYRLYVTMHTGICSVYFEGSPGPRIMFPRYVYSHSIYGENLRKVVQIARRDVESRVPVHKGITIVLSLFRSHWIAVVYCFVLCRGSCEPVHEDRTESSERKHHATNPEKY